MLVRILPIFLGITLISLIFHNNCNSTGVLRQRRIAPRSTQDYFDHITVFSDGRITRFIQMPIKVYISPVIKESPYLPELRYAMHEWETAVEGLIRFQETDTPMNADIRVSWGYSSLMDIHDTRLGSAQLRRLQDKTRTFSSPNRIYQHRWTDAAGFNQ